jgi:lysophospholipase L1-like esterase
MRRSRRRATAALALGLALVAVLAGCGGSHKTETRKDAEYVAFGDSYTAGAGMAPITDPPCRRSSLNYPTLVDKALKIKKFADRSCAGARLANLAVPQSYKDRRTGLTVQVNSPQLNALGKDTKLVTIGMGLNDQAISTGLLLICVTPVAPEPSEACQQYLKQPQSAIEKQVRTVAATLKTALGTIRSKAPHARIVLVGYPRIAPDAGSCRDLLPVPEAQLTRLRETMTFVNQVWSETARDAGALYVDMYTPSKGHDICSDDPWVSGYKGVLGKAAGLHPFPEYAKAVAAQVVKVLDE